MTRFPGWRWSGGGPAAALWLVAATGGFWAERGFPAEPLEKAEPAPLVHHPKDLLRTMPFDRLTLADGTQIDCEPISPRPLPEDPRPSGKLAFRLITDGSRSLEVDWRRITAVLFFEDMLLQEAERCLREERFNQAFELVLAVQQRSPNWPGLGPALHRHLLAEAYHWIAKNQLRRARELLDRLRQAQPPPPDLAKAYGDLFEAAIGSAFRQRHFGRSRRLLRELTAIYPGHPVAVKWTQEHIQQARQQAEAARARAAASQPREAFLRAREAAWLWPGLDGLADLYQRLAAGHRYVVVGVDNVADRFGPWDADAEASRRANSLLYQPLVELTRLHDGGAYAGRLVEKLDKQEFGRRLQMKLRPGTVWSGEGKALTASDVSRSLTARATVGSRCYDPRWEQLLREIRTAGALDLTVELAATPLCAEAWLLFAPAPGPWLRAGDVTPAGADRLPPATCGPFTLAEATPDRLAFVANPRYGRPGRPRLHELVEQRIGDPDEALRALLDGEVHVLAHVRASDRPRLRQRPDLRVERYEAPSVHFLAFDYRRPALANRLVRRAVVQAIDRRAILEELILSGPADEANRVVSAPFPAGSYAYDPKVEPYAYEPAVARLLAATAGRQMGGPVPPLELSYPEVSWLRPVVHRIQKHLKEAGLTVTLKAVPADQLHRDVAAGRPFDLAYRIFTMRHPIIEPEALYCPGTLSPQEGPTLAVCASPWLRQALMGLEGLSDWPAMRAAMRRIHAMAHDDVAVAPLFQVVDSLAYHQSVSGIGQTPVHLYQHVDTWNVEPWLPPE